MREYRIIEMYNAMMNTVSYKVMYKDRGTLLWGLLKTESYWTYLDNSTTDHREYAEKAIEYDKKRRGV